MKPMADAAPNYTRHWTYGDYSKWPEDERWELIDGVACFIGAPSVICISLSAPS
jgi:hypothetical protein